MTDIIQSLFGDSVSEQLFTEEEKEAVWGGEMDFKYNKKGEIISNRSDFIFVEVKGDTTAALSDGKPIEKTKTGKIKKQKKHSVDLFKQILPAIDRKDRNFYDNLTPQERKGITHFTLNRWISSVVHDNPDLVEWWLRATNERYNKYLLYLHTHTYASPHPKLQWLMATTVSPMMGKVRHQWIGYKKDSDPLRKFIREQFPHYNDSEVILFLKINSHADIKAYARDLGLDDKQIKKLF